jgi:Uma2 family endonuclease
VSHNTYMTSEQLVHYPASDKRTELVRGRLVVREPATQEHGRAAAQILIEIGVYLRAHPIGEVYAAETGFTLARNPDTVRAPDVAYVSADRVRPPSGPGFGEIAPDLVVEVLSPGDRARAVRTKVSHWLRAGTRLVWVIDARQRTAHVFRADGTEAALASTDHLDGESVLPGFQAPITRLLAG